MLDRRIASVLRLLSFVALFSSTSTSFAYTLTLCPRWPYSFHDNVDGAYEDGLKHLAGEEYGVTAASYTLGKLTKDGVTLVPEGFLPSSGCFPPVAFTTGTYIVTLKTSVDRSGGGKIQVLEGDPSSNVIAITKPLTWPSPPIGNTTYSFIITNTVDAKANAMAAAAQFLRESHIGFNPNNLHKIVVNAGGWAHADLFVAFLSSYQGINDAAWKYVIGHEVGHTIQTGLFGVPYPPEYNAYSAPQAICNCGHIPNDPIGDPGDNNDDHCIQSVEHGSDAQSEGWGHFIALDLMNDDSQSDGFFTYYKEVRCPSTVNLVAIPGCPTASAIVSPPMVVNGRHQHRWMQTRCPTSGYRGTEVDWMGFYFKLHTTTGGGQFLYTQFRDTYQGSCSGANCVNDDVAWATLSSTVVSLYGAGSLRATNWGDSGSSYGVNQ